MTVDPESPVPYPRPDAPDPAASAALAAAPEGPLTPGAGTWVILPTYNEADNLPGISAAILEALPGATLLVVDDGSPDGTGELADRLAGQDSRIRVRHRARQAGPGAGVSRWVRRGPPGWRSSRGPDGRGLVA